ncbi:MAG: S-layer homology domain-containing protein [bacterium]|nr:S-layer homology domain-containing protein [bacterium]
MFVRSARRALSGLAASGLMAAVVFGSVPAQAVSETVPSGVVTVPLEVPAAAAAPAAISPAASVPASAPAPATSVAHVLPTAGPFVDVPEGRTFANEIAWLSNSGITRGWSDGTFRPNEPVLRDAMAAFLHRFAGSPQWGSHASLSVFHDVIPGQTVFYPEITWLSATGITRGWPDGSFGPLGAVNRDQMAAFLYRLAGSPAFSAPAQSAFRDVSPGQAFYRQISWLASTGISQGWDDGTFRPLQPVTRAEMAAFLYRFNERFTPNVSAIAPANNLVCGALPHGGCFQVLDRGLAYSSGPGAAPQFVQGAIGNRWNEAGRWNSTFRYPTRPENCGLAAGGCVQSFQGGDIYWSPSSGAHGIDRNSAIAHFWRGQGSEGGALGYPVGPESCSASQCDQQFQGGRIVWTADGGARLGQRIYSGTNVEIGQAMAADHGWTGNQWTCLHSLWQRESRWNHLAANPRSSAYGIPQALPGSKMSTHGADWRTNPQTQIAWGIDYIQERYGSACAAWNSSQTRGWY